jgi:hypothetical protein
MQGNMLLAEGQEHDTQVFLAKYKDFFFLSLSLPFIRQITSVTM